MSKKESPRLSFLLSANPYTYQNKSGLKVGKFGLQSTKTQKSVNKTEQKTGHKNKKCKEKRTNSPETLLKPRRKRHQTPFKLSIKPFYSSSKLPTSKPHYLKQNTPTNIEISTSKPYTSPKTKQNLNENSAKIYKIWHSLC